MGLNVKAPLQVGGASMDINALSYYRDIWHYMPTLRYFEGCIMNITINEKVIDFGHAADSYNLVKFCGHGPYPEPAKIGATTNFIVAIVVSFIALILLVLILVVCRRQRIEQLTDSDLTRENIIQYEEEGYREKDTDYDIN